MTKNYSDLYINIKNGDGTIRAEKHPRVVYAVLCLSIGMSAEEAHHLVSTLTEDQIQQRLNIISQEILIDK